MEYQAGLQQVLGSLKLVDRNLMHITVRFLGNIAISDAKRLVRFLNEKLNPHFFPNGKKNQGKLVGVGDFRKSVFFASDYSSFLKRPCDCAD